MRRDARRPVARPRGVGLRRHARRRAPRGRRPGGRPRRDARSALRRRAADRRDAPRATSRCAPQPVAAHGRTGRRGRRRPVGRRPLERLQEHVLLGSLVSRRCSLLAGCARDPRGGRRRAAAGGGDDARRGGVERARPRPALRPRPARATSSPGWRRRSTACSRGSPPRAATSSASPARWRTSCARRSPGCAAGRSWRCAAGPGGDDERAEALRVGRGGGRPPDPGDRRAARRRAARARSDRRSRSTSRRSPREAADGAVVVQAPAGCRAARATPRSCAGRSRRCVENAHRHARSRVELVLSASRRPRAGGGARRRAGRADPRSASGRSTPACAATRRTDGGAGLGLRAGAAARALLRRRRDPGRRARRLLRPRPPRDRAGRLTAGAAPRRWRGRAHRTTNLRPSGSSLLPEGGLSRSFTDRRGWGPLHGCSGLSHCLVRRPGTLARPATTRRTGVTTEATGTGVPTGTAALQQAAQRHLWRHFAPVGGDDEFPVFVRGEGCCSGTPRAAVTSTRSPRCSASTPATAAPSCRGGRRPGARARLRDDLGHRPPARDRARRADRGPRPRRPRPRVLHLRRLGVGRVGAEARRAATTGFAASRRG